MRPGKLRNSLVYLRGPGEISAVCPTITPTLSAELLTDPGLEAWTTPTDLTSWTEGGTPTVNQEAVTIHGGASAARLDVDAGAGNVYIRQTKLSANTWASISAWSKISAVIAGGIVLLADFSSYGGWHTLTTDYTEYFSTFRVENTNVVYGNGSSAASRSIYIDDVSAKTLTWSTCNTLLGALKHKAGTYSCRPTIGTTGTSAGILFCYGDDNNFLHLHINGQRAYLDQRVAGVWSTLRTGTIVYVPNAPLTAYLTAGTVAKLYYNGAQVGADAATTALSNLGSQVRGFVAYAGNTPGLVTTSAATAP